MVPGGETRRGSKRRRWWSRLWKDDKEFANWRKSLETEEYMKRFAAWPGMAGKSREAERQEGGTHGVGIGTER